MCFKSGKRHVRPKGTFAITAHVVCYPKWTHFRNEQNRIYYSMVRKTTCKCNDIPITFHKWSIMGVYCIINVIIFYCDPFDFSCIATLEGWYNV